MSKMQQRRHFGMTTTQFAILGFLALIAIMAIFGTFILISSSGTPGDVSLALSNTPSASSQVNVPGQLFEPGDPSTIPTVTSNDQIPANWERYTSTIFEVSVPPQFESVHAEIERQKRIEAYRGSGFNFLADRLANDSFDYRLWFNFPQPETVVYNTHIVVKADILPTLTLDEYIDQAYGDELQGFQVIDQQNIPIGELEAQRVLLSANLDDISIGVAEYVITDEVNLWVISCSSTGDEFYFWLSDFDQVAKSFRLLY